MNKRYRVASIALERWVFDLDKLPEGVQQQLTAAAIQCRSSHQVGTTDIAVPIGEEIYYTRVHPLGGWALMRPARPARRFRPRYTHLVFHGRLNRTVCAFGSDRQVLAFCRATMDHGAFDALPEVNPLKDHIPTFRNCNEALRFFGLDHCIKVTPTTAKPRT